MIDSFVLHTDLDENDDLVELLTHGTGKSRKSWKISGLFSRQRTGVSGWSGNLPLLVKGLMRFMDDAYRAAIRKTIEDPALPVPFKIRVFIRLYNGRTRHDRRRNS